jgi:uncharacterized protein
MEKKSLGYRILHFPLTKILVGIIALGIVVAFGQFGIKGLVKLIPINEDVRNLIGGIILMSLIIPTYIFLYKFYEKRKITEFSTNKLSRNLLLGIALGFILQSLTILVIYLNKGFSVIAVNSFICLLPSLTMALTSAIFEETLFRGIIFRITEEKLGSYIALIISATIFGLMHLFNPNSNIVAAIGLVIEAGLLLGAAYIYSRSLWLPIGIHFAWNLTQSGIYGAITSGNNEIKGLLTSKIEGNDLITGGQFGPEGSIQALIFCLIVTIILMILSHRQNKIIKPYWIKD